MCRRAKLPGHPARTSAKDHGDERSRTQLDEFSNRRVESGRNLGHSAQYHSRGPPMTFRRRLLGVFAVIIIATVVAIGWAISSRTREVFERTDDQRTDALVQQFRREFQRRGDDVARRVKAVADSESVNRMTLDLAHGGDSAAYLT